MQKHTSHLRKQKASISSIPTQSLPSRRTVHQKRSKKPLWLILGISLVFLLMSGFMYNLNQAESNTVAYSPIDKANQPTQPTSEQSLDSEVSEKEKESTTTRLQPLNANSQPTTRSLSFSEGKSLSSEARPDQSAQVTKQKQTQLTYSKSTVSTSKEATNNLSRQTKKTEQNNQQNRSATPTQSTEKKPTNPQRPEKKEKSVKQDSSSPLPWDPRKRYQTGDTVLYRGKIYEANWPNQNQKPDNSFFWFQYWSEKKIASKSK